MLWDSVYPKSEFKFPWKIAEFIVNGNRPRCISQIDERVQMIIKRCWDQDPTIRANMKEVVQQLQNVYEKL